VKLAQLPGWTRRRQEAAARYDEMLIGAGVVAPTRPSGLEHVYHVYAVLVHQDHRGRIQEGMKAAGIATGWHYPCPVHLQPAYQELGYRHGAFPVSERLAGQFLSLPMFPELTAEQQQHVCEVLHTMTRSADVGRFGS
jgi:dTDP-4-amino-4,6-dideoxygalactose transaminase